MMRINQQKVTHGLILYSCLFKPIGNSLLSYTGINAGKRASQAVQLYFTMGIMCEL